MIRKITLKNFMSHKHSVLELDRGVTVLLGPNNAGKSAVVAALQSLCENGGGDFMVRHGEKRCEVSVETEEGHIVRWIRDRRQVSYELDGRKWERLNRTVPQEIVDVLRLPKVNPEEGEPFDVHFAMQKKPLFLIDETPRRAAVFFASSSDASHLMEMQKRHRDNTTDRKRTQTQLVRELEDLDERLYPLEGLESLQGQIEVLQGEYQSIAEDSSRLSQLEGLIQQHETRRVQREYEEARVSSLGALPSLPILEETETLEARIEELGKKELGTRVLRRRLESLDSLAPPPALLEQERMTRWLDRRERLEGQTRELERQNNALGVLEEPPRLEPCESLAADLERLQKSQTQHRVPMNRVGILDSVEPPPSLLEVDVLEVSLARWGTLSKEILELTQESKGLGEEMNRCEEASQEWFRENPTCPTCGQSWTLEHSLGLGKDPIHDASSR